MDQFEVVDMAVSAREPVLVDFQDIALRHQHVFRVVAGFTDRGRAALGDIHRRSMTYITEDQLLMEVMYTSFMAVAAVIASLVMRLSSIRSIMTEDALLIQG